MAANPCTHPPTPEPVLPASTMTWPLRVLVIDAHPAVGRSLVRLLGIMPGLQIRGLASCGSEGVKRAGLDLPDVILVDAELPREAASATIRRLRHCLPSARVVALGLYPDRRAAMLAAGAHAFVLKDAGFDALCAAITDGGSLDPARSGREPSHRDPADRPTSDRSNQNETAESASASTRTPRSVL